MNLFKVAASQAASEQSFKRTVMALDKKAKALEAERAAAF